MDKPVILKLSEGTKVKVQLLSNKYQAKGNSKEKDKNIWEVQIN